jgi:hypothetical protein
MLAGRERDKEDVEMILTEKIKELNMQKISQDIQEMSDILQNNSSSEWNRIKTRMKL